MIDFSVSLMLNLLLKPFLFYIYKGLSGFCAAKSQQLREEHAAGRYGTDCQLAASQFEQLVELHKLLLATLTSE